MDRIVLNVFNMPILTLSKKSRAYLSISCADSPSAGLIRQRASYFYFLFVLSTSGRAAKLTDRLFSRFPPWKSFQIDVTLGSVQSSCNLRVAFLG